jgi:NADPH2:quinone reductase
MKALMCRHYGSPETLTVEEVPGLHAGENEVVVRVRAAGLNFPDSLIIQNQYQIKPPLPFSPGGELAGEIIEVGPGVSRYRVGQRVIAFTGWGGFAEQALVSQDRLIPMPEGMPFDIAGSFLMVYGTCYHALHDRAALVRGEIVLVLGAAGGIGLAAIEIAKAQGARVIAAASSPDKLAVCQDHGADELINYRDEDLRERLKVLTDGHGVDVVCDPVGGAYSEPALRAMAWRGRYLVVGFADGSVPRIALNLPLLKGCSLVGVFWGDFIRREPEHAERDLQRLVELYRAQHIRPLVSARYTLDQAPQALRALMAREIHGKVVIEP